MQKGKEADHNNVQRWRQVGITNTHWQWHHNTTDSPNPSAHPQCCKDNNQGGWALQALPWQTSLRLPTRSQMNPFIASTCTSYNWLTTVNFPTIKPRKHSKSSSYNTQSDTMKLRIGFACKTGQHSWSAPFPLQNTWDMVQTIPKGKRKGLSQADHDHCSHSIHIVNTPGHPKYPKQNSENTVISIPRVTALLMTETVITASRKGASSACVGDWENSPPRMNGTLNVKEVDLGQECTADPGTTATKGTNQTVEGTDAGVAGPFQWQVYIWRLLQIPIQRPLQIAQ